MFLKATWCAQVESHMFGTAPFLANLWQDLPLNTSENYMFMFVRRYAKGCDSRNSVKKIAFHQEIVFFDHCYHCY